jgi:xylulose-5-phosphate/fructose-6-phosphate phosphoketolase
VKPRPLGHWGTTPGLNFVYAHLNRAIPARDLNAIYVMGPGHGGPGPVAAAWSPRCDEMPAAASTRPTASVERTFGPESSGAVCP